MSFKGQLIKAGIDSNGTDISIFDGSLTLTADNKLIFRDSGCYIYSNADGYLTIEADTGLIIAAALSFTGVISFSGSIALTGDLPATHGLSVTMNAPMVTLGNIHVSGIHADITQTSAVAGTGTAEGRLYGIRSIVRQELDLTNCFGVHGMVIATPAASANVNDFVGVYGGIEAKGTFANSNSGLSSWAALKGDIWNTCTGSWDSQVYTLMLSYGSSVNYSGETAFMHAYNHGDTYMDYGLHLIQNSTVQAVAAMILIDPATSTTITTGIDIDGAGTITTGIDIGSATTGIALTGTCTNSIDLTGMTLTYATANAFLSIGSLSGRKEITMGAGTGLYALQVACDSIANPSAGAGTSVYCSYMSMDATTADQANSQIGCLLAHAHIYKNVYSAYGLQGHATIKDSMETIGGGMAVGVAGKFTVDNAKTMSVGNAYGVLGIVSGAGSVTDNCYALVGHVESGVTAANGIAWLYSYSSVATAILISSSATITTGIDIGDNCTTGIDIGACTTGIKLSGAIGAATGRGFYASISQLNAAHGDGYGANEIDVTLTGTSTSHVAALSSWINITAAGTHGGGGAYINALSLGVYIGATPTISAARVNFGFRASYQGGQTPANLHLISYSSPGVNITSMFHIGQFHANVGVVAAAGESSAPSACVKFMSDDGGNVKYIRLYDDVN